MDHQSQLSTPVGQDIGDHATPHERESSPGQSPSSIPALTVVATSEPASVGVRFPTARPLSIAWYWGLWVQTPLILGQLIVSAALIQLFALGMPIFNLIIFDRVFGRQNLATLDVMGIAILVIITVELMVKALRTSLSAYQLEWLDKLTLGYWLEEITRRLNHLPNANTLDGSPSESLDLEAVSHLVRINQVTSSLILLAGLDLLFASGVGVVLFLMHPVLAGISMIPVIPISVLSFFLTPNAKARYQNFMQGQRATQLKLAEFIQHRETLISTGSISRQFKKLETQIFHWIEQSIGYRNDLLGSGHWQGFVMNLGSIITLYVGAHYVLKGEITFGVYIAINMMSRLVTSNLQRFIQSVVEFQSILPQRNSLKSLFDGHFEDPGEYGLPINSISTYPRIRNKTVRGEMIVDGLRFSYPGSTAPILQSVRFTLQPGERVVLAGRSGVGKTTLARLLQNLLSPQQGLVALDGYPVADWDAETLRQHVGLALQRPGIISGTLEENLRLANPNASHQDLLDVCRWVELEDVLQMNDQGLNLKIQPNGANLSGGQINRIGLARTLLAKPSILILDEALAQLPPTSTIRIFNTIHKHFRQNTCLFISHFLPLHQGVDRILLLEKGEIIESGNFKTLAQQRGAYFDLYLSGLTLPTEPAHPQGNTQAIPPTTEGDT